MKERHFRSKYLEINIKKYQHLAFEFLPYGFGYDNPLFIIKLFIISFYISLPFKIKEKDSDISYGFSFIDYDEPHKWPDYLRIGFGRFVWYYNMPWYPVLFETIYDSKVIKGNIHIKDIDNNSRICKYEANVLMSNGNTLGLKYYKETRTLKCKVFGRFIDKGKKEIYVLNVDYDKPNTDLSERGIVSDMIFLEANENTQDGFKRYCKENNLTRI